MVLPVVGGATPGHASNIAGNKQRSVQTGRREHAFGAERAHLFLAPFSTGVIGTPGVGGRQALWREWTGRNRKGLRDGSNLARHVGSGDRPFFHDKDGLAVLALQNKKIAG